MNQIDQIIEEEINNFNANLEKLNEVYSSFSSVSSVPLSVLKLLYSSLQNIQTNNFEDAIKDLNSITLLISTLSESIQKTIQILSKES